MHPDFPLILVLAASGTVALSDASSSRRRMKTLLKRTVASLGWTGHTLETIYHLRGSVQRLTIWGTLVLLPCIGGLALMGMYEPSAFLLPLPELLELLRLNGHLDRRSLLIFLNCAALLLNALQVLSEYPRGPLIWCFGIAGVVVVPCLLLYEPICTLRDTLSRLRVRYCASGAAARLPPEVRLHVFHYLRKRARFGAAERLPREHELVRPWRAIPFAAARACASWHAAATEALYCDVFLRSEDDVQALCRTPAARPGLALATVRRVFLPEHNLYHARSRDSGTDASCAEFARTVDRILALFPHATEALLFRAATRLADVPGFRAARHLRNVTIHGARRKDDAKDRAEVDVLALLLQLPRAESLALDFQLISPDAPALNHAAVSAFARVHPLRRGACTVNMETLARLLRPLPSLRVAALRNRTFMDSDARADAGALCATQLRTAAEPTVLASPRAHPHILARDLALPRRPARRHTSSS
ncbi:hypothetical protein AURDEDRAFT_165662 [Auricularia subglabra TFB-10046 SS5]|nr:hypothetical protein AURDEDRAFT_165662 [Auricularia subglabra TFB-10046 SS5]